MRLTRILSMAILLAGFAFSSVVMAATWSEAYQSCSAGLPSLRQSQGFPTLECTTFSLTIYSCKDGDPGSYCFTPSYVFTGSPCGSGFTYDSFAKQCVCPSGSHMVGGQLGSCEPDTPPDPCPDGQTADAQGECKPNTPRPADNHEGEATVRCTDTSSASACLSSSPDTFACGTARCINSQGWRYIVMPESAGCSGGSCEVEVIFSGDQVTGGSGTAPPSVPPLDAWVQCIGGYSRNGQCVCATGYHNQSGTCIPDNSNLTCPSGYSLNANGVCVQNNVQGTPSGTRSPDVAPTPGQATCPVGYTRNVAGECVSPTVVDPGYQCPSGYTKSGSACVSDTQIGPGDTPSGRPSGSGGSGSGSCGGPGQPACGIDTSRVEGKLDQLHQDLTTTGVTHVGVGVATPGDPLPPDASTFAFGNLTSSFSGLRSWTLPPHSSECPRGSFSAFGGEFVMSSHCDLIAQHFSVLSTAMMVVWSVLALRVVLSA